MADILLVGSANIDRVWWLAGPLQSGGRSTYTRIEMRCGGGGFFTGVTLLALGHRVQLATTLADDVCGRAYLSELARLGFDTRLVKLVPGNTVPLEILVEPSGQRTIIAHSATEEAPLAELPEVDADLVYVNRRKVREAAMTARLADQPIVSQFPLEPGERRPAHVLIAGRSDLPPDVADDFPARSQAVAGAALETLVLTDGDRPVHVWDAAGETRVPVPPGPPGADTTGAGDAFAAGFIDAWLEAAGSVEVVRRGNATAAAFLADSRVFPAPVECGKGPAPR